METISISPGKYKSKETKDNTSNKMLQIDNYIIKWSWNFVIVTFGIYK